VPDKAYSPQELVNICCLVDKGREFAVDTHFVQKRKTKFSLRLDSYKLDTNKTLKAYAQNRGKKKDPPPAPVFMEVYRSWLKKYLDWFNPDLYVHILAHSDGMTVERIRNQLASEDPVDYQMSGVKDVDPLMVPLPKMHEVINTGTHSFGEKNEADEFIPYCKNTFTTIPTYSQDVVQPLYDEKLTASCNPPGFEEVPVARMPTVKVPLAHMQITGIRADMKIEEGVTTLRWLGLQGGKYVSLPTIWVEHNFDDELLSEAKQRAERVGSGAQPLGRFLVLPVGDSRNDDPPFAIRANLLLNYYYQGNVDNCVMGGLVNAVYWMLGPDQSDLLLSGFVPAAIQDLWQNFVIHVNHVLREGYWLKRLKTPLPTLDIDDSYPLVVHLKAKDDSQNHAVCLFRGHIYDSASRYVLVKGMESLNWCCGAYPFSNHLRIYQLQPKEAKVTHPGPTTPTGKKKKRRRRGG
jgi:hypothetical protein